MTTSAADIQQLYIAYFNRPADVLGLQFWMDKANAAGSTVAVANAFSNSTEYTSLYAGKSSADIVNSIYNNLFGRDAEPAGLIYWANKLNTGALDIGHVAYTILSSAQNADLVAVQSKTTAATTFTASLTTTTQITGYDGAAANAVAKTWLAGVTDATSLAASIAAPALAQVSSDVVDAKAGTVNVGITANLTSNVDTVTGGTGNDTIVASTVLLVDPGTGKPTLVTDTLQSQDVLSGGAGNDTLKVTISEVSGVAVAPTLTGIENVVVTFKAGTTNTLDLVNASGVTKVTVDGSTDVSTVSSVGDAALAVNNVTGAANIAHFDGSTATVLNISAMNTGASGTLVKIDAGLTTASAATSEAISVNNSFINLDDTTNNTGILSASIAATGSNKVSFTDAATTLTSLSVTGSGKVSTSAVALTALKTLTVADGGITFDNTGSNASSFTATTGAGKDALTLAGGNITTVSTGAGNDSVTVVTALVATAKIDLGAGDDLLKFSAAPLAGVTLTGGDGNDTIAFVSSDYTTVTTGFSATNLAKISGFEVLGFTDAVAAGAYDVSKLAGVGSFTALSGVATTAVASLTGLAANSTITLAGDLVTNNGTVAAAFASDTTTDVLNFVIKGDFADDNNATALVTTITNGVDANKIETVNIVSTGNQTATFTAIDGYKADSVLNVVSITNDAALTTVNISGDQAASYSSVNTNTKLALIDATANTAGVTIDASASIASTNAALTIKGSAAAASSLTGSANADTIIGGTAADTITGGAGGDTLTGGGGNNKFVFVAGDSTIATGNTDTITDFHANTYGAGTNGALSAAGATTTASKLTGDVIALTHTGTSVTSGIQVQVVTNAGDAQTFLQTAFGTDAGTHVHAALNSTTGDLYIDLDGNGTADMFIHLTGVTTINSAAFTVA